MITKRLKGDFARVYRPCRISEVYGQERAKSVIGQGLDEKTLPNAMLFYGESGVGKTSMAKILAMGLSCERSAPTSEPCCLCGRCKSVRGNNSYSFLDFNSADLTGVDHMRRVISDCAAACMDGSPYRTVVFDECHRLSRNAQDALLKALEEAHIANYFILCSTDPEKIIETVRNRCMPIEFFPFTHDEMLRLLTDVCEKERLIPVDGVLEKIIEQAGGKARNALFLLQRAAASGEIEKRPSALRETLQLVQRAFSRLDS